MNNHHSNLKHKELKLKVIAQLHSLIIFILLTKEVFYIDNEEKKINYQKKRKQWMKKILPAVLGTSSTKTSTFISPTSVWKVTDIFMNN